MLETVDLKIPPRPEYISVARLTAAAIAVKHAFTYNEIEDLKVAVSEACNVLMGSRRGPKHPIALHFVKEADALVIRIEARGPSAGARVTFPDLHASGLDSETAADARALGVFLMQCLVDEVRRIDGDGGIALQLRKRQRERSNGNPPSTQ